MDATDKEILRILQRDSTRSLESIAEAVSISVNTCWRRVKQMEERGVIQKRVAVVNPDAIDLGQTVFVSIRTNTHSSEWLERFTKIVNEIPEVIEFYRMAGDVDYILKIVVSTVADYDRVYKRLIADIEITDVSATFAMECLKRTTELPL